MLPSSKPLMHTTVSKDSGKNSHYPPMPEIPTLGMSGRRGLCPWDGEAQAKHDLHRAQVSACLEHLIIVRSAGATSPSPRTLPAPGPRPALTHAPGPCLPPPPPGGFPRPVCTVETAARQRLGARPGEVGDPRGPERREERRNSGKKEGGAAGNGVPGFAGALPGTGRTPGALAADLGPRS